MTMAFNDYDLVKLSASCHRITGWWDSGWSLHARMWLTSSSQQGQGGLLDQVSLLNHKTDFFRNSPIPSWRKKNLLCMYCWPDYSLPRTDRHRGGYSDSTLGGYSPPLLTTSAPNSTHYTLAPCHFGEQLKHSAMAPDLTDLPPQCSKYLLMLLMISAGAAEDTTGWCQLRS